MQNEITLNGKTWLLTEKEEVKEWEILSFRDRQSNTLYNLESDFYKKGATNIRYGKIEMLENLKKKRVEIFSVRRLSDNEVFTLGEDTEFGKIEKIRLDIILGIQICTKLNQSLSLKYAAKPTTLLTTNEGVQVINPENTIYILHKDFSKGQSKAGAISKNQNNIYFWSEESLNNYITQNKPVPVTAIELAKAINFTSDQLNQLVDFFKAKNKQT